MPSGLGMTGWIGLAPEASGGVAVPPVLFTSALSESMKVDIARYESANIAGRITEPDDHAGTRNPGGEMVMAADPVNLGYMLGAIMHPAAFAVVVSGAIWSHLFRPHAVGAWDQRYALPPFTLVVYRDVGQAQVYGGCVCTGLELGVAVNQAITLKTQWLGTSFANGSYAAPTLSTAEPFKFDTASLSIDGVPRVDIESFRLAITQPMEQVATLRASAYPYKIPASDFRMVRGTLGLSFDSIDDLQKFTTQAEMSARLTLAQGSFSLAIDLPRFVFTTFPTGVGGRGRQVIEVDFRARRHVGSGTAVSITLVSPVPFFVIPPPAFSLRAT